MLAITYTGVFRQDYEILIADDPSLQEVADKTILHFQHNPADTRIGVHALQRRMAGKWAIEVTDDIRIIFEWLGKSTVRFLAIGGHEHVYRKKKPRM